MLKSMLHEKTITKETLEECSERRYERKVRGASGSMQNQRSTKDARLSEVSVSLYLTLTSFTHAQEKIERRALDTDILRSCDEKLKISSNKKHSIICSLVKQVVTVGS